MKVEKKIITRMLHVIKLFLWACTSREYAIIISPRTSATFLYPVCIYTHKTDDRKIVTQATGWVGVPCAMYIVLWLWSGSTHTQLWQNFSFSLRATGKTHQ